MTSLPSQQDMSPEQKAVRKQQLDALNDACDRRLGRDTSPLFTEKNLSKSTLKALDETEPIKHESKISHLYKVSPDMEKKLQNFDKSISDVPAARKAQPILSMEERTRAYHKALGTPQHIVDAELASLKAQEAQHEGH